MTNCGHCHTCGTPLRTVLDGEEWCATCQAYRRYPSHGWGRSACTDRDDRGCPPRPAALAPPVPPVLAGPQREDTQLIRCDRM